MAALALPQAKAHAMQAAGKMDFHNLVLSCNKDGMEALRKGQTAAAFEQFKYAETILIANQAEGDTTSLSAVTCNNLGCYYKKVGKLHGALSYLRRALQMEVELKTDEVTLAGTHLNICAVLSKLEKHDKAVQHALSALELINRRVSNMHPEDVPQDDYSVLAIAYHNVAVERDLLQQYDKAAAAFQQGHEVAKRSLGEDHPLAITLGKNCEAVLKKAQKLAKPAARNISLGTPAKDLDLMPFTAGLEDSPTATRTLPALPGVKSQPADEDPLLSQRTLRRDAAEWVAGEEQAWNSFAKSTLSPGDVVSSPSSPQREARPARITAQASISLREAQMKDLPIPHFRETSLDIPFNSVRAPRSLPSSKKSPYVQVKENSSKNVLDIIEADRTGLRPVANAPRPLNDYRPNRMMKGCTRTSRVMQRSCAFNETSHRDKVMSGRTALPQKSEWVRKLAAERIQRTWRAWYKYCRENSEWLTTTWIAATMIQAHWRSYHVRRQKWDKAAIVIQKWIRGYLVRKQMRRYRAAVCIQRHVRGMNTRNRLRKLNRSAVKISSLIRGGLARRRARSRRHFLTKTAVTIQCALRCHLARRKVAARRAILAQQKARETAAINIQRVWRGRMGRRRAAIKRAEYMEDLLRYNAATKLQAMVRRDTAIKKVDKVRAEKFDQMNKAATLIRKVWKGAKTRRRYKELLQEFERHSASIVVMQRYARGFLVRLKMWRQATRAEEELWAALEIQRVWRGYCGRVKWEAAFEQVWRREMAAALLQRNLRGWLARTKVERIRRRIARAEFERARQRFRAAQKIQALARGVLVRRHFIMRFRRARYAAVQIQRIARGHALRKRLWLQVMQMQATKIQAGIRGCLVRRRRFHLIAKAICIQRNWRRWLRETPEVRERALADTRERKNKAIIIQKQFRQHKESKDIDRIHLSERVQDS